MRVFSNKRGMLRVLCVLLMALTIFMPNVVEAASLTVYVNTSKDYSASASGETLYVTLSGASGNAILKYSPSWTTCTKGGNSPTITVEANDSGKDRSGSVVYMDGDNKTYTLNIKQKAQKVTVQFNLNGGSGYEPNYYSREYTVGTKYDSLPVAPTPPTGYRFDDWFSGPYGGYRITADTIVSASYKTLYARYLIRSYTISFNTDGGSYVSPKSVTYKNNYGTLTTPTKEYYSFQGWFTSNGSQVFSDTPMNTAADHTLYARWKRKTVTVKFNDNGGSGGVSERTYDQGAAYGYLPAGPTPPKGYSFKGWYTAAQGGNSVSTGSIVSDSITALYAQYSPNKYIVKLNSNGGTSVTEKQVTFDSTYGTLTSPTRTGYIFKGWYNADGKQVTSGTYVKTAANHTLVAHWTANTYKITFSSQGGSSVAEKNVTYDSTYGTLVTPSKTGYDFQGWYTAPSGGDKITSATQVKITQPQVLYAQWKGKKITVKFNVNGGSGTVPSQDYIVGNKYDKLPAKPTEPSGYSFTGWYTKSSGGTQITTASTVLYDTQTLYAQYTPKSYTITFDSQCGISVNKKTVTYNTKYGTLSELKRTGYIFNGWYTTPATGGSKVTENTVLKTAYSHTLYARWTAKTFTVGFDSQGGSNVTSTNVVYNRTYGTLPTPSKLGYDFTGWYTAKSGGTQITSGTQVKITANQTLYAHWTAKKLTVTYNSNGGPTISQGKVTYNSTYGTLPAPTRTGYTFQGWYREASFKTKVVSTTKVTATADHTLYARWTAQTFPITFSSQGGTSVEGKNVTYDSTYGTLIKSSRTGYDFVGWFTAASGGTEVKSTTPVKITKAQTLYAHWKAKEFTVSYNSNGGPQAPSKQVTYDSTYGSLPVLKRTGYAFLGWYREASFKTKVESTTKVTATANHTLYARWSANTYLVTFSSQGGTSVASINVIYDGTYGTMVTPSRNGYTFLGWFTAIEGGTQVKSGDKVTITKNQTLYAHWKGNTITVKFDANGGSNSTSSKGYVVGNKYTDLPTPSAPAGYIFDAWYTAKKGGNKITSSSTVSPSYTTLYAQYKARNYTVTYDSVGGSSVAQVQVTYGNTYGSAYSNKTLPKPQKDRYEFVGWYTAANNGSLVTASSKVATAKNHTLYARWKVAKVEVKFDSNGGKGDVPSQIYTIGEEYKKLPVGPTPAKSYWSFDGWYTAKIGGEKIQTSTIVSSSNDTRTLYAHYVYDFFSEKSWLKLEPAKTSKTIPFNSVIQRQKGITIADYQAIFDDRLKEYKSADDTADEYYADLLQRVMKVDTVIGLAGIGCPVASDLYFHYRYGNGDLLEYDASHFILGTDLGLAEFKRYTLDIMKRMEKLVPGQKVTFVDENTGSRDYVNFIPDPLYDISEWDSHYAVRAAWLGPSGSCVFDGSTYKLDLYFYVQDYYHFYYPKNVAERKAGLGLNGIGYIVQNDELAFLVIRGYAKPFESCGVYHVSLDWEKGQNVENVLDEYIFISRF